METPWLGRASRRPDLCSLVPSQARWEGLQCAVECGGVGWGRRGAGRPKVVWTVPRLRGRGASLCSWPRSRLPHRRLALALQDDHCGIYSCRKGATSWPNAWHGAGSSQRSPSPPPAPALALDLCFHFPPNVYSFIHSFVHSFHAKSSPSREQGRLQRGWSPAQAPAPRLQDLGRSVGCTGALKALHSSTLGQQEVGAPGRSLKRLIQPRVSGEQWRVSSGPTLEPELRPPGGGLTVRWDARTLRLSIPRAPQGQQGRVFRGRRWPSLGFGVSRRTSAPPHPACAGPLAMRPLCSGVITSDFSYSGPPPPGSHHSHTCQTSCLLPFPAAPEDVSPRPALTRGRVLQLLLNPHPAVSFLPSSSLRSCTC